MLQRPVNDQYDPSFLCGANCRTGCAPDKFHCCRKPARANMRYDTIKAQWHRENETRFCGSGCHLPPRVRAIGEADMKAYSDTCRLSRYRRGRTARRVFPGCFGDGVACVCAAGVAAVWVDATGHVGAPKMSRRE